MTQCHVREIRKVWKEVVVLWAKRQMFQNSTGRKDRQKPGLGFVGTHSEFSADLESSKLFGSRLICPVLSHWTTSVCTKQIRIAQLACSSVEKIIHVKS